MIAGQENTKQVNKKSRVSNLSQTSKKSLCKKSAISSIIKNSKLKTPLSTQRKKYSKSKNKSSIQKQNIAPYLQQSKQNSKKNNKSLNSLSKTVPLKNSVDKALQFPFEAIKFKQKINKGEKLYNNTCCNKFYIQYDQPEEIDLSLLDNSKKIINSHNHRIARYSNQIREKNQPQYTEKDAPFKKSIQKLFSLIDPQRKGFISAALTDCKSIPHAALYFLGGIFQKMRQHNSILTQPKFQQECFHVYKRSSIQDIRWFIEEIQTLVISEKLSQNISIPSDQKFHQKDPFIQIDSVKKQLKQNEIVLTNNLFKKSDFHNFSFYQDSSFVSFRKQNTSSHNESYPERHSYTSQANSFQSAKFGQVNQTRMSHSINYKQSLQRSDKFSKKSSQKYTSINSNKNQTIEEFQDKRNLQKIGQIKKNIPHKPQDLRGQIYARLDKMRQYQQEQQIQKLKEKQRQKQNQKDSEQQKYLQAEKRKYQNIRKEYLQSQQKYQQKAQKMFQTKSLTNSQNFNLFKFKNDQFNKNILQQVNIKNQFTPVQCFSKTQSLLESSLKLQARDNKGLKQNKQNKWVNKNKNCQNAFSDLSKLKDQFQKHKDIIDKRQKQNHNYFKRQLNQISQNNEISNQDLIIENQNRIVKASEKRNIKIEKKYESRQNNSLRQSLQKTQTYQKNIDRLNAVQKSRRQNNPCINLNDSLTNSCRKTVQVTLPLKYSGKYQISLSQKKCDNSWDRKFGKIDKIDQLSQKLEDYLKKNAQKIQYSKNFTQTSRKFQKILPF